MQVPFRRVHLQEGTGHVDLYDTSGQQVDAQTLLIHSLQFACNVILMPGFWLQQASPCCSQDYSRVQNRDHATFAPDNSSPCTNCAAF